MARPFLCSKCGNWYTPVPRFDATTGEPVVCGICIDGGHAAHPKTGVIDCHFEHDSATPSEVIVTKAYLATAAVVSLASVALTAIGQATKREQVDQIVKQVELKMAEAMVSNAQVEEALRWAGVMELPGLKALPRERRFKSFDAVNALVEIGRRPPSDLVTLQRSLKVCAEVAAEIPAQLAQAKVALQQVAEVATAWGGAPLVSVMTPSVQKVERSEAEKQAAVARMAHARAARKVKQEKQAVPA